MVSDDLGHGEGLARPGDAEQGLEGQPTLDTVDETVNRGALVPSRFKRSLKKKACAAHSGIVAGEINYEL